MVNDLYISAPLVRELQLFGLFLRIRPLLSHRTISKVALGIITGYCQYFKYCLFLVED